MRGMKLDIAFGDYDRTRGLADGTVAIDGVEARCHGAPIVTEIFERMVRRRAFHVAELGLTFLLRTAEADPAFLAIPVFPVRLFRHSGIFVHKASGITRPEDLAGKTVGELALYGHDAGVMPKGILSDDYGVTPAQSRWVVGGVGFPMPRIEFVPQPHPANVEVRWAAPTEDLGDQLENGEIDALISAIVPRCVLERSPKVGRLFEDYEAAERDYHRRTGIFPIMHTVVVRRELAEEHPDVVRAVYQGFCDAKDAATARFAREMMANNVADAVPWLTKRLEDNREVLGADPWPYGIRANRAALDAILRYHHEQGLTARRFTVGELFVPYLLDT